MPSIVHDENLPIYEAKQQDAGPFDKQDLLGVATPPVPTKNSKVQEFARATQLSRQQHDDKERLRQRGNERTLEEQQRHYFPVRKFVHDQANDLANGLDEDSRDGDSHADLSDPSPVTFDSRPRMNGDSGRSSLPVMTALPNGAPLGKGPSKGLNGDAPSATLNGTGIYKPGANGHNGTAARPQQPENISTDYFNATSNGLPSSQSPLSNYPPAPTNRPPEVPAGFRSSVDSLQESSSVQQTPVDAAPPKSLLNGDTTQQNSVVGTSTSATAHSASGLLPRSATSDVIQRQKDSSLAHRYSSPPHYPSASSAASASASALAGPSSQLKHRSTLDVPKPASNRGSKDGSDTAFSSGRFSPTGTGPTRRTSLSINRRNTRSLHSELPRDEVVPDDDALRWAEAYRQKRAKKKKREEIDDDKVLVGTKVDETHANWVTAYNMLTGIRVSVSRTNAKLDRPLTDADFEAKQKSTFDIAGNELVPSAKYDFKFKDYAPWVFRHLRALFRLDPADYLVSLTGKYILSELGSPGKSGSFFYFSRDYKYIIKTIHHAEHKFLRKILKDYYNHVTDNPNTLLSQFYGLHRVKMPYGKKIHFVVMNNLFPPHRDIHSTFDLKGSTVGRDYKEENLEKNPRATLKDLNWLRRKKHLELGIQKKQLFLQQLERDVRLMQKLKIMDYSLLIGVHDLQKGNNEGVRGKTLQVFNPGGDGPRSDDFDPSSVLMRTPSKLESARKARELRQMIKAERPIPVGQTNSKMPEILEGTKPRGGIFYKDDGGLQATHEDNTPGEEIYYLGVIDCLTHYGMVKKVETFWKGLSADRTQISSVPPQEYGERFLKFMSGITMSPEQAARDEVDRQAAAVALTGDATMEPHQGLDHTTSAPPAPNYLPPPPPSMRSPGSPEPNPTVETAARKALNDKDVAREQDVPERLLTTTTSTTTSAPGKASTHAVLPIVEEAGEGGSVGEPSRGDSTGSSRPYTPNHHDSSLSSRPDGFTDLGPHGIGGRGPPTPPKSSSFEGNRNGVESGSGSNPGKVPINQVSRDSLDKALPPIPPGGN